MAKKVYRFDVEHPAQAVRPCIGQNTFYALGDCLTSTYRPEGCLQPRKLWLWILSVLELKTNYV